MFNNQSEEPKMNLNISLMTAFKVTSVVLLMLLSVRFLNSILSVLLLFLPAIFLAVALNPIIVKVSKLLRIKQRVFATTIAFTLVISVIILLFAITVPPIVSQVVEFSGDTSKRVEDFKDEDNLISNLVTQYQLDKYIINFANDIGQHFTEDVNNIVDVLQQVSYAVGALLVILVMSFMLLLEGPLFMNQVRSLLPHDQAQRFRRLSREMSAVISGYISGQLLIAVIGGLVAMLFMSILDVDNALALAGIVALFALIPLIGAFIGAAIVVALTLLTDVNAALILGAYFIIYQQIENTTIQPWIQGQQTNLSVLQVFLAALIGAKIFGFAGALLAVPVAACLKILIIDYFKTNKDYLEKVYLQISNKHHHHPDAQEESSPQE